MRLALGRFSVDAGYICFCGDSGSVETDTALDPPCNIVAQTGCAFEEKCGFVLDDTATGAGHIDCVPDGTLLPGEACDEPEIAGESDDCARGGSCYGGRCREICTTVNDQCFDGVCTRLTDDNGNPRPPEICLPACDPLLQDCAREDDGCYFAGASPACVAAGDAQLGDSCASANECVEGLVCVASSDVGFTCHTLCGPWPDCVDATGAPIACGMRRRTLASRLARLLRRELAVDAQVIRARGRHVRSAADVVGDLVVEQDARRL